MKIDGRQVISSGTIVIAPGEKAELALPFGTFELKFNPTAPQNIRLSTNPMEIRFDGTDNPLGLSSTFTVPLTNGKASLVMAIYSIGESSSATRILHYTLS